MSGTTGDPFCRRIRELIKIIPRGKVATYRHIAALAGNHRGARQVAWVLASSSRKYRLPWQRVINSRGTISLKPGYGYEEQKGLLEKEGIAFDEFDKVNLNTYLWRPVGNPRTTRKSAKRSLP